MSTKLLNEIGEKLNIKQGTFEDINLWRQRIIYSAIGMTALASLWDKDDSGEPVSITHFKHRIEKQLYAYRELYPDLMQQFTVSSDELSKEIYDIYLSSGFIYHSSKRLYAAKETKAMAGTVVCIRGANLKRELFMSGLGTYIKPAEDCPRNTVREIFRFSEQNLDESYKLLNESDNWKPIDISSQIEYLRVKSPFSKGYWKDTPDRDGFVSLLRFGMQGRQRYCLYKYEGSVCLTKELPRWMVDEKEYIKIANILLYHKGTLPAIKFSDNGNIVAIRLDYLLPSYELWFLKAYSWPLKFSGLPSDFKRVMSRELFEPFKEILENMGYQFTKE